MLLDKTTSRKAECVYVGVDPRWCVFILTCLTLYLFWSLCTAFTLLLIEGNLQLHLCKVTTSCWIKGSSAQHFFAGIGAQMNPLSWISTALKTGVCFLLDETASDAPLTSWEEQAGSEMITIRVPSLWTVQTVDQRWLMEAITWKSYRCALCIADNVGLLFFFFYLNTE